MTVDDTTTHVLRLRAESSPHTQQWMWNELDLLIEFSMRRWHVPGLAIALVEGDSIVRTKGYGIREIGKPDRVDEHTLFAIASCTKAFTASALAMLYDAGNCAGQIACGSISPTSNSMIPMLHRK